MLLTLDTHRQTSVVVDGHINSLFCLFLYTYLQLYLPCRNACHRTFAIQTSFRIAPLPFTLLLLLLLRLLLLLLLLPVNFRLHHLMHFVILLSLCTRCTLPSAMYYTRLLMKSRDAPRLKWYSVPQRILLQFQASYLLLRRRRCRFLLDIYCENSAMH